MVVKTIDCQIHYIIPEIPHFNSVDSAQSEELYNLAITSES